jgi:hypothetical protein
MSEKELYLYNFAPLIQLWAGICLLFFYEKLFRENNPFEKWKKSCAGKVIQIHNALRLKAVTRYQSFFIGKEIPEKLQEETPGGNKDPYWLIFRKYIYNTAILSFFYAIIILIYIGVEKYEFLLNFQYHTVLLVLNTFIIIYFIVLTVFYRKELMQKLIYHAVFLLFLVVYLHLHRHLTFYLVKLNVIGRWQISQTWTTVYTIVACLSGMICILLNVVLVKIDLWRKNRDANNLEDKFDRLTTFPFKWGAYKMRHPIISFKIICGVAANVARDSSSNCVLRFMNRALVFFFMAIASDIGNGGKYELANSENKTIFDMFEDIIAKEMLSAMNHLYDVHNRLKQPPRQ